MDFFDPHFHIWDLRPESTSGHDASILHECPWISGDPKLYSAEAYEADCDSSSVLKHVGGVFIDAMSVSYVDKPGAWLQDKCLAEAGWVAAQLGASKRSYKVVPSACLEDPNVAATLQGLKELGCVGIRQILNLTPSWPRNEALGELLDNAQWRAGYAQLEAVGFSFDMQLNPHQFAKAAAVAKAHPGVPVIINHMGTPTADDLGAKADAFWEGMAALAALPHVAIKVSMLVYVDKEWDKAAPVIEALRRVIALFGDERVCFAVRGYRFERASTAAQIARLPPRHVPDTRSSPRQSNFPVDIKDAWPASRLYTAFVALAAQLGLSDEQQRKMFAANAKRLYRAS